MYTVAIQKQWIWNYELNTQTESVFHMKIFKFQVILMKTNMVLFMWIQDLEAFQAFSHACVSRLKYVYNGNN